MVTIKYWMVTWSLRATTRRTHQLYYYFMHSHSGIIMNFINIVVAATTNDQKPVKWPHITYTIHSWAHIDLISFLWFARHSIRLSKMLNACATKNQSPNRYVDTCAAIFFVAISSMSHSERMMFSWILWIAGKFRFVLTIYFNLFHLFSSLALSNDERMRL